MHYTKKQLRVMEFIRDFQEEHRISPTLEEISSHLDISKPTAFGHLEALRRKGAIEKTRSEARSVRIIDPRYRPRPVGLAVIARVEEGRPLERLREPEPLDLNSLFATDEDHFAVRVEGSSLLSEGLLPGDYVVVERRYTPQPGEAVLVVLPDRTATIKRYFQREDGMIKLQPLHEHLEPRVVRRCDIRGIVVSVHRSCLQR
jgi:repressor LexA